ncbi:MAG: carboxypeptidase-like regulatory domain-containing protein [Saprospiraceae bacterium]
MKKINISTQLIACLLLMTAVVNAQTIKAIVADEESRQVIPDVFVFLDNSSTGAITGKEGRFELKTEVQHNLLLVFSHLNYELKSLAVKDLTALTDTIFLTPSGVVLEEAIVVEKAKPRVRSRWLKRFKSEFLGEDYDKSLVHILNPEVLLFKQDKGKLIAESKAPLIIENKVLGYKVQFFLEDYKSYREGDLVYYGKVFFEELTGGSKKEIAKYKRNRYKVYEQSSRHFFANLVQQNEMINRYEVGFSLFNKNEEFINYEPFPLDSLLITEFRKGKYEISINRILTITNNTLKINQGRQKNTGTTMAGRVGNFKQTTNNLPQSYLWSKHGRIVVNKYGSILNPTEVEEAGYWASLRVAALLPLDYAVKVKHKN